MSSLVAFVVTSAILLGLWSSPGPAAGRRAAAAPATEACALAEWLRREFETRVPFEVVDGRIYVQVRVDGEGPFRFAVDTGASGAGRADASLVARLGLDIEGSTTTSDGVDTARVETTRLGTVELGRLVRRDLEVITRDYSRHMSPDAPFSGILGRGFFEDGLLVIDYPRQMLSFSRRLSLPADGPAILEYERPFRVPVSIGDTEVEGHIDTGANVAFVVPQALYTTLRASPLEPAGAGRLANGRMEMLRGVVPGPFRIGEARLADVEVRVSDRYPELLVGAHALRDQVLMIDQPAKRIAVCSPRHP